jgi:hypothetical protein
VTHDGVGPVEYVVRVGLVMLLGVAAFRQGRRAIDPKLRAERR